MKPCPYCAEEIQDAAIKCKHCNADIGSPPEAGKADQTKEPKKDFWWSKNWHTIVWLFLFFPVGLYFLWTRCTWSRTIKLIFTLIVASVVGLSLSDGEEASRKHTMAKAVPAGKEVVQQQLGADTIEEKKAESSIPNEEKRASSEKATKNAAATSSSKQDPVKQQTSAKEQQKATRKHDIKLSGRLPDFSGLKFGIAGEEVEMFFEREKVRFSRDVGIGSGQFSLDGKVRYPSWGQLMGQLSSEPAYAVPDDIYPDGTIRWAEIDGGAKITGSTLVERKIGLAVLNLHYKFNGEFPECDNVALYWFGEFQKSFIDAYGKPEDVTQQMLGLRRSIGCTWKSAKLELLGGDIFIYIYSPDYTRWRD